jgi:hypothetical protein
MGQRLCALVVSLTAATFPAWARDQASSEVRTSEMEYFETQRNSSSIDDFLTRSRPEPLSRAACAAVIATLPRDGELHPNAAETAKIAAARQVLQYHRRSDVVTFKVIKAGHAFVGLHARSVLLASREALSLVSADEFAALVAHEIAHDYMWQEYRSAMDRNDHKKMQELELRCDGIAVLTLHRLGIDIENLVSAVQKMTRFNRRRNAIASNARYVPLTERITFIRAIAGLPWE